MIGQPLNELESLIPCDPIHEASIRRREAMAQHPLKHFDVLTFSSGSIHIPVDEGYPALRQPLRHVDIAIGGRSLSNTWIIEPSRCGP